MGRPELRLLWSDEAEHDLIKIWRYGADEWSPATADEHLTDIHDTCALVLESPGLGRSRDELMPGIRSFPLDPHIIFYRVTTKGVQIVRILHEREDIHDLFQKTFAHD